METEANNSTKEIFKKDVPSLGTFSLKPFDLEKDTALLHQWVIQPYATYWEMSTHTLEEVKSEYAKLIAIKDYHVYTGFVNGEMAFLMESYNPSSDLVGEHYSVQDGDWGMHVLVGPPTAPKKGFTWQVFTTILDFLFTQPHIQRVVVEPDVRNDKIHQLNKRAGFIYEKEIQFPHKTAHLAFCSKNDYAEALQANQMTLAE